MSLLTRDQILKADDLKTEVVKVPEWRKDGEIIVSTMSGTGRDEYESDIYSSKGSMVNTRAKLLIRCIVDKDGKRLFTEKDIVALGAKSAKPLDRCFDVARKLNGIGVDDVEEATKN